jgi:hypothetical protein
MKKRAKIAYAEFDSTCLDSAMFDAKAKTITVTFARDGSSYDYDCTRGQWNDLLNASSVGQEFNFSIKE